MTQPGDDITVKIKGRPEDALAAIAKTEAAIKGLGDTSHNVMPRVKDDFNKSGTAISDFDRLVRASLQDGQTTLQGLRRAADDTRTHYRQLLDEFNKTGAEDVWTRLKQAEDDFKKLDQYTQAFGVHLGSLAPQQQKFQNNSKQTLNIFQELQGTMSGFGPAIALGVAALSPLLGGLVGGTVLSVLAGGGLAAGIISQFGDPRVGGALSQFGHDISSTWHTATEEFAPATADALATLDKDLQPVIATVGQAVGELAPFMHGIADAIGKAAGFLGKDLAGDMGKMEPIFTALERSIPVVAQGIGEFFNAIADHAPEIASDIETIAHGFETLMNVTGHVVGFLASDMAGIHALYQMFTGDWAGFAQTVADAQSGGAVAITRFGQINQVEQQLADTTNETADSYAHLADEMHRSFEAAMQMDRSQIAMYETQNALNAAIRQNGKDWRITSQAGEANRTALLDAIQATENYYTDLGKVNGITPQLNSQYQQQIDKLLGLARQAGLSKDQVALLKGQFDNLYIVMGKVNSQPVTVHLGYVVANRPRTGPLAGVTFSANSGVVGGGQHFDNSGVYAGANQPLAIFAEGSTRREAMISEFGDRNRALATGREAMGWFGYDVVERGRRPVASQAQYVPIQVNLGGQQLALIYAQLVPIAQTTARYTGTTGLESLPLRP